MIICMPFSYMDNFYWKRYYDQIEALSNNCDGLFIPIYQGIYPDNYDKLNVELKIFVDMSKSKKNKKTIKDIIADINIIRFPYYLMKRYRDYNKFAKECSNSDYDVVLGYSGAGTIEYWHLLLGKYKDVKVIHRMRGYGKKEREYHQSRMNRLVNNKLDEYAWRKYDYHIPIKYRYYKMINDFGVDKSIISKPIGLGINTELFYPYDYPDKLTLGFIGRISEEKNIRLLVNVMKKTPDINYIVVGKKFMDFRPPDNCNYIGTIHKDKINKIYNNVNAVLLPSKSEGVSNVMYEAYATGRILICSESALSFEYPIFGKKLKSNVNDWVNYLYSLTPEYCKDVGSNAVSWSKNHTWNNFGIKITNECRKLLK